MNAEEIKENADKTHENSRKILSKFLKYLGKIEYHKDYNYYIHNLNISIIEWIIERLIINPFLILICLSAILNNLPLSNLILLAEGISILWFLIIEFKKDLWRKH